MQATTSNNKEALFNRKRLYLLEHFGYEIQEFKVTHQLGQLQRLIID